MTIQLKHQPTANTCVATCLAMITGLPVETVIDEFHDEFMGYNLDVKTYLETKGVIVERTEDRHALGFDSVYLLIVPSLNSIGQFHCVLCDTRQPDENTAMTIYDPARKTSQRYTAHAHDAEPGETPIMTWIIDWKIVHAPAINIVQETH